MWETIIGFIGGPLIRGLLDAYNAHLKAETTDAKTAADLAGKEIAVQQVEVQANAQLKIAEIGHPWEVEKLFAYVTLFYYSKLLIWDKVLGLGSTDALTGWALWAANLIIGFYFAKRGFENVARIIRK